MGRSIGDRNLIDEVLARRQEPNLVEPILARKTLAENPTKLPEARLSESVEPSTRKLADIQSDADIGGRPLSQRPARTTKGEIDEEREQEILDLMDSSFGQEIMNALPLDMPLGDKLSITRQKAAERLDLESQLPPPFRFDITRILETKVKPAVTGALPALGKRLREPAVRALREQTPTSQDVRQMFESKNFTQIRDISEAGMLPLPQEIGSDFLASQHLQTVDMNDRQRRAYVNFMNKTIYSPESSRQRERLFAGEMPEFDLITPELMTDNPVAATALMVGTTILPIETLAHNLTHPETWPGHALVYAGARFLAIPMGKGILQAAKKNPVLGRNIKTIPKAYKAWLRRHFPSVKPGATIAPERELAIVPGTDITFGQLRAFKAGTVDASSVGLTPEMITALKEMPGEQIARLARLAKKQPSVRLIDLSGHIPKPEPGIVTRPIEETATRLAKQFEMGITGKRLGVGEPIVSAGAEIVSKDTSALKILGYANQQIKQMLPQEANRILQAGVPAIQAEVLPNGLVLDEPPAPGNQQKIQKSEQRYIDESPPIGLSIKVVGTPPGIEVIPEEKDLTGFSGQFKRWMAPVRLIAPENPVARRIGRMGRDTMLGMANEINKFGKRIDGVKRGLSKIDQAEVIKLLESKQPVDLTTVSTKLQPAYIEMDNIRTEMLAIINDELSIDVSTFGISPEEWWPHIFVGEYQVQMLDTTSNKWKNIGFARNLRESIEKAGFQLQSTPQADVRIKPRGFDNDYSATLLTRKGFGRFLGAVAEATELDKDEVVSLLRGVAAIKPRGKFAGNLKQRAANLGDYMTDFDAMKIYSARILRKKWLDPFRKDADALARNLPPALREYFLKYIDDVSGKYDPFDNRFQVKRDLARVTRAQAAFKLGFRPTTALVNLAQPAQLGYQEIGNYLFRGYGFMNTPKGKEIIEKSGVVGQVPKFAEMGTGIRQSISLTRPIRTAQTISLGMFSKAESINRRATTAGGYLFGRKVFTMPREDAKKRGLDYVYQYLDEFGDPETAAIEYAKDFNDDVNFDVGPAGLPQIFRDPVRKTALQFKSFPVNFVATVAKMLAEPSDNPRYWARLARFTAANLLLGGVRAVPFVGRKLWKLLILTPLVLPFLSDENREKVREVFGRGVGSLIGVDFSERVGAGDFMPRKTEDLLGPAVGDVRNIMRWAGGAEAIAKDTLIGVTPPDLLTEEQKVHWRRRRDWDALVRSVPQLRDIITAMRDTENIVEPSNRMRAVAERTGWDRILQFMGVPLEKVRVTRDWQRGATEISRQDSRKRATLQDELIDLALASGKLDEESFRKQANIIFQTAEVEGVSLNGPEIALEIVKKSTPSVIRTLQNTPVDSRPEVIDFLLKVHRTHDILPIPDQEPVEEEIPTDVNLIDKVLQEQGVR